MGSGELWWHFGVPRTDFAWKDPVQLFCQTCCLLEQEIFRVLYSANRPPEILAIEITLH